MKGKTKFLRAVKKATPTILSVCATVGVVATAAMAVQATPKALRLIHEEKKGEGLTKPELVKIVVPIYAPAIGIGAATIGCIFGANTLNQRQQAALASAYALASQSYTNYKSKVKELYGEEAHDTVMNSIAVEKSKEVKLYVPSIIGSSSISLDTFDEEKHLFYEPFSNRYFESTVGRVLQAEYHLNRNFMLGGFVTLNEFYRFLGLEEIDSGDSIGWEVCDEYYWIDFDHSEAVVDDGLKCCVIDMVYCPRSPDYSFNCSNCKAYHDAMREPSLAT